MPTQVMWHDSEKSILRVKFEGTWTSDEFWNAFNTVQDWVKDYPPGGVILIVDAHDSAGPSASTNPLPLFRRAFSQSTVYQHIIFAGGSSFALKLVRVVTYVLPQSNRRLFFEASLEAAEKRITSLRAAQQQLGA